jgi:hypothetical protein
LYGVARQTALRARAANAKRRRREKPAAALPELAGPILDHDAELRPLLDQELGRLPDRYRLPILLCDLEGKSHKEAAQQLGWAIGTLSGRLSRARNLLARRLTGRGLALTGTALAAAMCREASAATPGPIAAATVRAIGMAVGRTTTAGVFSAEVIALTEGVVKTMLVQKIKLAAMVVAGVLFIAGGLWMCNARTTAGESAPEKLSRSDPPLGAQDKENGKLKDDGKPVKGPQEKVGSLIAWGRTVAGFEAGIGYRPGQMRAYYPGEKVTFVIKVRNDGKRTVRLAYYQEFFLENPPQITDLKGRPIPLARRGKITWKRALRGETLPPGGEVDVGEVMLALLPDQQEKDLAKSAQDGPAQKEEQPVDAAVRLQPGSYWVSYDALAPSNSSSILAILATGQVELKIGKGVPPKASQTTPPASQGKGNPKNEPEPAPPQPQDAGGGKGKQVVRDKFWAGISVNQPYFISREDTVPGLFQINFALVNQTDQTLNPDLGKSQLLINGVPLREWAFIVSNGPKTEQFNKLPPGEAIRFGYALGNYFEAPGEYRVQWRGQGFQSNEITFRVVAKRR